MVRNCWHLDVVDDGAYDEGKVSTLEACRSILVHRRQESKTTKPECLIQKT